MKSPLLLLAVIALFAFPVANLKAEEAAKPGRDNGNPRSGLLDGNALSGGKIKTYRAKENGTIKLYTFTEEENGKIKVKEMTFGAGGNSAKEYEFESVEDMKKKDEKLYKYYEQATEVRSVPGRRDWGRHRWGLYLKNMPLDYTLRYLESGMLKGNDAEDAVELIPGKLIKLLKKADTVLKKHADCSVKNRLDIHSMAWLPECVFKDLAVKPICDVVKAQMKLKGGVTLVDLPDDSEFAKAGLEKYDIIIEINGREVTDIGSLNTALTEAPKDKKVEIRVIHEGKEKKITMKIPEVPAPDEPGTKDKEKDAGEKDREDMDSVH
ncbi:MAG: hypothetical protein DRP79_07965 [Planctomycetota bacterium]|nr:MAG: hypothetical protein DRP79_07965 [Planctomycetota bacterium]